MATASCGSCAWIWASRKLAQRSPALAIESRALLGTEQSCVPHAIVHGLLLGAHSLASDFNVAAHL